MESEDIGENQTPQRTYLEQGLQNLHEIMFFCEEKYKYLQQSLLNFYAWSADTSSSPCGNCSNCQHRNQTGDVENCQRADWRIRRW